MKADLLIIGQAPGPRSLKRDRRSRALDSDVASGARLAQLAGVSSLHDHARVVNLLKTFPGKSGKGDRFPMPEARERARLMRFGAARRVVFVGQNVARAFGAVWEEYFEPFVFWKGGQSFHGYVAPHPSGVNRWWNDPDNLASAKVFWTSVLRDPEALR